MVRHPRQHQKQGERRHAGLAQRRHDPQPVRQFFEDEEHGNDAVAHRGMIVSRLIEVPPEAAFERVHADRGPVGQIGQGPCLDLPSIPVAFSQ